MADTRDEQLALIKEKCIAANPEIVEKKFGCRLARYSHYVPDTLVYLKSYEGFNEVGFAREDVLGEVFSFRVSTEEVGAWQIIGRPIRLADVLLSMKKHNEVKYFTTYNGHDSTVEKIVDEWDLFQDALTEQSDETITFLFDLLK